MPREQLEAKILEEIQGIKHPIAGMEVYLLREDALLALLRMTYAAGEVYGQQQLAKAIL